jgi:hypothetical protein
MRAAAESAALRTHRVQPAPPGRFFLLAREIPADKRLPTQLWKPSEQW